MENLKASRSDEASTIELFRDDRDYAAFFRKTILEDGDQDELLLALRRMAAAFGGMPAIAAQAEANAMTLCRTLSAQGDPELRTATALLKAMGMGMGMRIAVQAVTTADTGTTRALIYPGHLASLARDPVAPRRLS